MYIHESNDPIVLFKLKTILLLGEVILKFKYKYLILLVLPLFISSSVTAFAATRSIGKYSYNVPGFGGSYTTGSLKKVSRTGAVNNNTTNGGGRTLYSMMVNYAEKPVTKEYSFAPGQRINMPYIGSAKDYVGGRYKMIISSKLSYFSNTHTSGYWSPDDE